VSISQGRHYCAFCNSKEKHHPYKCPLLKELGLKLIKVGGQGGGGESSGSATASTSSKPYSLASPVSAPATVGPPPAPAPGLASAPEILMAAVIQGAEGIKSSTNSFRWYGNEDGAEFKPNTAVPNYLPLQTLDLFPYCCHASVATHVSHGLPCWSQHLLLVWTHQVGPSSCSSWHWSWPF
jgi:hypothetical protein